IGIDARFNIDPPLSKGVVDRHNWDKFIDFIKDHYKDNIQVEIKPNYINFKAGEHPKLPFKGHKFLRFSSKVSGSTAMTSGVERYINTVARVACVHFGSHVKYWNEAADQYSIYGWKKVNESIRSYEQPDESKLPTSIAHFINGTDPLKELEIPLFEIKNIPGKGKGLVARFNISSGTRILCEKPLFTVRGAKSREELETMLVAKLKAMSKSSQRQFLSLHNKSPGKYPFSGIFKTNALPCGSSSPISGVYPTACFINHSCTPNAHNSWNSNEEDETIHAIQLIKSG
ncbi:hypothetical protein P154DRAFT_410780, partial [Amniculicola lignicola CBS 123094]